MTGAKKKENKKMAGNGGYLYPVKSIKGSSDNDGVGVKDLGLRDYFAAAALQGILARAQQAGGLSASRPSLAAAAYEYADEMLKARQR
jgi:hypothetical protein